MPKVIYRRPHPRSQRRQRTTSGRRTSPKLAALGIAMALLATPMRATVRPLSRTRTKQTTEEVSREAELQRRVFERMQQAAGEKMEYYRGPVTLEELRYNMGLIATVMRNTTIEMRAIEESLAPEVRRELLQADERSLPSIIERIVKENPEAVKRIEGILLSQYAKNPVAGIVKREGNRRIDELYAQKMDTEQQLGSARQELIAEKQKTSRAGQTAIGIGLLSLLTGTIIGRWWGEKRAERRRRERIQRRH